VLRWFVLSVLALSNIRLDWMDVGYFLHTCIDLFGTYEGKKSLERNMRNGDGKKTGWKGVDCIMTGSVCACRLHYIWLSMCVSTALYLAQDVRVNCIISGSVCACRLHYIWVSMCVSTALYLGQYVRVDCIISGSVCACRLHYILVSMCQTTAI
jgi:hypothetical protein